MLYILRMSNPTDSGMPTELKLIGPFHGRPELVIWLQCDAVENLPQRPGFTQNDDPCWQVVELLTEDPAWMQDDSSTPPNAFMVDAIAPADWT